MRAAGSRSFMYLFPSKVLDPFEFVPLARCVLISSEAAVCRCETEMGVRIVGGQLYGFLQLCCGARRLFGGKQSAAQNQMRGKIAGARLHGQLAVLRRGFGIFTL